MANRRPPNLLHLPLELLLKMAEYLSFADLWYLATSSKHCRALAHQLIWHRYHIDLSRPQLNQFNHIVHAGLAYISRHGYAPNTNAIDQTIIQSVSNRLAVEIYDRSPLKNWEPCLDFFLDKTLGIILDHVFLDPLLDIVPKHTSFADLSYKTEYHRHLLMTEFYPTRMGRLMTTFLTTLYPTMMALFEADPTTEIHHRLLLNHINRHLDNMSNRYHNHHKRRLLLIASPRSARATALAAVQQHNQFLRLNFRILIRFIGTLVQTDLLSANDLDIITRQRIQFFFLTTSNATTDDAVHDEPLKKRVRYTTNNSNKHKITFYESLKKHTTHYCWQMWLEEIEFQMEIFLDLTRAVLLLEQSSHSRTDLNVVSSMLDDTVSALISKRTSEGSIKLEPTTATAATAPPSTV
ncbi:hypothetical protein V8B55DRAFT_1524044 [Mucor lusitanicus]|uniref:F-box domain-containing protein n=2 Tax=Mucor circinelloides f. lusitanicus TaxID=29924 RepID=A0A168LQ82_MUCCL|nr:hypothetical protein FB192DRAFT_1392370 [Mucor lusitanicus]OAD03825.1 hypothetical protein MUCCIDRAFT_110704 [Mucor lusitanicus CBS 277.49]